MKTVAGVALLLLGFYLLKKSGELATIESDLGLSAISPAQAAGNGSSTPGTVLPVPQVISPHAAPAHAARVAAASQAATKAAAARSVDPHAAVTAELLREARTRLQVLKSRQDRPAGTPFHLGYF